MKRERTKESSKEKGTDGDGKDMGFLRPRACARRRSLASWLRRINAAGVLDPVPPVVDEAVKFCHGSEDDRLLWLKIANRNFNSFIGVLMEFELDCEKHPDHPLRNPSAAFQKRLNRVLPKSAKGGK